MKVYTPNAKIDNNEAFINSLAQEFAYNYFSSSFGDEERSDVETDKIFENEYSEIFRSRFEKEERIRNILIIGAGASHDLAKAIPLGIDLIEEVKTTYENNIKNIPFLFDRFKQEESEIVDITGKKLNFENYLYLLSKCFVTQKELRHKIKQMTGYRYTVSLFNEIVAHMFKHAFIDVIINFNFEETLDQAIEEEIGLSNYHSIISDGHCVDLSNILVDGRLKIPVYIKPHGTFSHKSTLRFTNRHYFDLPSDIENMLSDLVSGKRGKKEIQRVNIICVGYAMESIEFNKILNEKLPAESRIYNIGFNPATKNQSFFKALLPEFIKRANKIGNNYKDFYHFIDTSKFSQNKVSNPNATQNLLTPALGELFSLIWRQQYYFFRKAFYPRSIARHEILSYLFYDPLLGIASLRSNGRNGKIYERERYHIQNNIEESPKYFRDRTLVELALALNRNNGIIDIAELLKERVGFYYLRYRELCTKHPNRIKKIETIYDLVNEFSDEKDITDKKEEFQTGKNIFILNSFFNECAKINDPKQKAIAYSSKLKILKNELVVVFKKVNVPYHSSLTGDDVAFFVELLKRHLRELDLNDFWNKKEDALKYDRSITLIHRLLISKYISNDFKFNFLLNFHKLIYNGRDSQKEFKHDNITMFQELIRLFSKSVSRNYFVINPKPKSPIHFLWESFSQKKLIHTNLTLTYTFITNFWNTEWDIILAVSETGSFLDFLKTLDPVEKELLRDKVSSRHLILICSYEAVKQLYPYTDNLNDLINNYKEDLVGKGKEALIVNFTLLLIPFNQHNHHSIIFLKTIDFELASVWKNIDSKVTIIKGGRVDRNMKTPLLEYMFQIIGGIYLYKQGFSNNIDPLFIGTDEARINDKHIQNDLQKLLISFIVHLIRFFLFINEKNFTTSAFWDEYFLEDIYKKYFEINLHRAYMNHLSVDSKEVLLKEFLSGLFNQLLNKKN